MKLFNIKLLALMGLLSMAGNACAYMWTFTNLTSKTLVIGFGLQGRDFWNFNIVKPLDKIEFGYGGGLIGFCMSGAEWIEYDPNMKIPGVTQNGGLDMKQPGASMLPDHFRLTPVYDRYYPKRKPVEITYLPVPVYEEAVKNAARIGSGFDTFFCNAVALSKILNKGKCPTVIADIISWFGGIIARSTCANRDFEILEDTKGNIAFITYLQ